MKRFVIGFVIGLGLMYWYLENRARVASDADTWMQKSASGYRHDRMNDAAREALGDKGKR